MIIAIGYSELADVSTGINVLAKPFTDSKLRRRLPLPLPEQKWIRHTARLGQVACHYPTSYRMAVASAGL
jgi:hypothetical protein